MSDPTIPPQASPEEHSQQHSQHNNAVMSPSSTVSSASEHAVPVNTSSAKVNYILYLIGLVIGLTALIGLIFAYVKRGEDNPSWLQAHYNFQIKTFWYGLGYLIIGSLLSVIIIGWFILLFWVVWLIIRCVKGLSALDAQKPIEGGFFSFGN